MVSNSPLLGGLVSVREWEQLTKDEAITEQEILWKTLFRVQGLGVQGPGVEN